MHLALAIHIPVTLIKDLNKIKKKFFGGVKTLK